MKLESVWRTRLKEWVTAAWGEAQYMQMAHGNEVSAGLPDIQVMVRKAGGADHAFLELKAVKDTSKLMAYSLADQPTKLQTHTLHRIHKAGGNARVLVFHNDDRRLVVYPVAEIVERRLSGRVGVTWAEYNERAYGIDNVRQMNGLLWRVLFG